MDIEDKRIVAEKCCLIFLCNEIQMRAITELKDVRLRQMYKKLFNEMWNSTRQFTGFVNKAFAQMEKAKQMPEGELQNEFDCDVDELEKMIYEKLGLKSHLTPSNNDNV